MVRNKIVLLGYFLLILSISTHNIFGMENKSSSDINPVTRRPAWHVTAHTTEKSSSNNSHHDFHPAKKTTSRPEAPGGENSQQQAVLEKDHASLNETIKLLQRDINTIQKQLTTVQTTLNNNFNREKHENTQRHATLEADCARLAAQVTILQKELDELHKKNITDEAASKTSNEITHELIKALETDHTQLVAEAITLQETLNELRKRNSSDEIISKISDEIIHELIKVIEQLDHIGKQHDEKTIKPIQREINALQEQIATVQVTLNNNFNREKYENAQQHAQLEADRAQLAAQVTNLQKELDELHRKNTADEKAKSNIISPNIHVPTTVNQTKVKTHPIRPKTLSVTAYAKDCLNRLFKKLFTQGT